MDSIEEINLIVLMLLNSLSISLSLFAIIIYIMAKHLRVYAFKLVFWMNLADLFRSLAQLIPQIYNVNFSFCEILGVIHVSSSCLTLFWSFVIAVTIYQVIVKKILDAEKYYNYWLGFGLSICGILGLVPMFYNSYGNISKDCTLKNNHVGLITKFAEFYMPAFFIIIFNTVIFYKVYKALKKENEILGNKEEANAKRLFYYPIILVITIMPSMINRAAAFFNFESQYFSYAINTTWSLQGVLNPLCYSLTKPVKNYILSGCKNKRSISSEGSELNKASILLD
ncbi:hypothetical protein SteCoe_13578 [Stentor coeruleus]|uniref:G-protein coupled receptors family 1 profile domain-containing protein n=1 Tax=Stentor coeruleus TaxID=5963 RepID=A0A1R2C849_9CILI|nr:hypothetical protein SteCoe_13578 [Stentor coeruleus]